MYKRKIRIIKSVKYSHKSFPHLICFHPQKRIPYNSEEDPVRFINFSRFEALSEKQQQVRDFLYPVTWRKYSVSIR